MLTFIVRVITRRTVLKTKTTVRWVYSQRSLCNSTRDSVVFFLWSTDGILRWLTMKTLKLRPFLSCILLKYVPKKQIPAANTYHCGWCSGLPRTSRTPTWIRSPSGCLWTDGWGDESWLKVTTNLPRHFLIFHLEIMKDGLGMIFRLLFCVHDHRREKQQSYYCLHVDASTLNSGKHDVQRKKRARLYSAWGVLGYVLLSTPDITKTKARSTCLNSF